MSIRIPLACMLVLVGCAEGPTDLVDASAVEGEWTFLFQEAATACIPETGGSFQISLNFLDTLTDIGSGDVYVTGRWYAPQDPDAWSVAEGVFMIRNNTVELRLWGEQVVDGAPRIEVRGDIDDRPGITGEWIELDGSLLYEDGCSGTVDGHRIP